MKNILSSIKTKLQLTFLTFIVLSAIAGILSYKILDRIVAQDEIKTRIDQLVFHFAEARKQEKDFILYDRKGLSFLEQGSCESLQKHKEAMQEVNQLINQIKGSEKEENDDLSFTIQSVQAAIQSYESTFKQLVKSYSIRGFKDHGLEGEMREVVHRLQECQSKEEQWFALMLRRHEKDFFIRLDPKYIQTLHKRASEFKSFVEASGLLHMDSVYKAKTIASIQDYVTHFDRIAGIEKAIGLSKEEGLMGNLTEQAEMVEPLLAQVQFMIYEKTQSLADNSKLILLISCFLMLLCGIGFSILLSRGISSPIVRLSQLVEKASIEDEGIIRSLERMKRRDELGKLVISFMNMFREINLKVQEVYQKNEVLQAATQKEKERIWLTEGISLFDGIMAKHTLKVDLLCDEILLKLVKYTNSKQAVLFLKEKDENGKDLMQVQSCYAHDKKRYVKRSIQLGEGLAGAVWQEKEPYYLTDIPESYSKIRSGLGEAKPTAVFIVPAMVNNEVEAVVEMGTFGEYTGHEKELILQVCKGLAGAISRLRLQDRTQQLLNRANSLTEELKQNEEEMRQQLEEMVATQEEYEMKHQQLHKKVDKLQNNLRILSDYVNASNKGVLISDSEFNLVYRNEYWAGLFAEQEHNANQKINHLLNISEKELEEALQQQHQVLLQQLNRKAQVLQSREGLALTDIKVEEYRVGHKTFYSILAN